MRYVPKHADELRATAKAMVEPGKGVVALDESNATCTKRFEAVGATSSEETRRQYRQLLITAPDAEKYVSGAILFDETIRQSTDDGTPFVKALQQRGQIPGIKVDTGAKDMPGGRGEKLTEGLDGLRERMAEYYQLGARFAKWRAVITIGEGMPTIGCYKANAHALARYAALCQEAGIVPMIEPEVLIDGPHSIEQCEEVTERNLRIVFQELAEQEVMLEGTILKTSMVISGLKARNRAGVNEVADRTVQTLMRTVPPALGGVVFLSGGQGHVESSAHLNAMNERWGDKTPWNMTFSYARALQQPALDIWGPDNSKVREAQAAFLFRAKMNSLASTGSYTEASEKAA